MPALAGSRVTRGPPAGLGAGHSRTLATLLIALAALAWGVLWWWSASPHAGYLGHGGWADLAVVAALCRAVPQGAWLMPALLHGLAWVLMIAAMMLPTTYPLLALFRRIVAGRADAGILVGLVVAGFFAAWFVFGLAAHAADLVVQWGAPRVPGFAAYAWVLGAVVLAGAGLFQFSALKYRCLEACHTPFSFIMARWHGRAPRREAWHLGFAHGVFCIGCCWALMLLMFLVGMGNMGLMLVLAVVMAAEKNLPWGRRLRAPLGLGLIGAAVAVVAVAV